MTKMLNFSSPRLLVAELPLLSGVASYGLSAWIASANGEACDLRYLPGVDISAGVTFIALIVAPATVVAYRAITTRKTWLATIGLTFGTAALSVFTVLLVGLIWAAGHSCFD